MPCELPGGVDAEFTAPAEFPYSYELGMLPLAMVMLDALVGGVGKVCALSSCGLPDAGWGAMECGCGGMLALIGLLMEWWCVKAGACVPCGVRMYSCEESGRRAAIAALPILCRAWFVG